MTTANPTSRVLTTDKLLHIISIAEQLIAYGRESEAQIVLLEALQGTDYAPHAKCEIVSV